MGRQSLNCLHHVLPVAHSAALACLNPACLWLNEKLCLHPPYFTCGRPSSHCMNRVLHCILQPAGYRVACMTGRFRH